MLCIKITSGARSVKGMGGCVESLGTSHSICHMWHLSSELTKGCLWNEGYFGEIDTKTG